MNYCKESEPTTVVTSQSTLRPLMNVHYLAQTRQAVQPDDNLESQTRQQGIQQADNLESQFRQELMR